MFWFIFYFAPIFVFCIFTLILSMNVLFSVVLLKINLLTYLLSYLLTYLLPGIQTLVHVGLFLVAKL